MSLPKPYYQDSACTIYHGDCREILPELAKVDLVLTDPPYGLGNKMAGGTWMMDKKVRASNRGFAWDMTAPPMEQVLKAGISAIIWGGNYFVLPPSRCWLIWHKPDAVPTMADVDMAWTSWDRPSRYFKYTIAATNPERGDHPTPKPLSLMKWCLNQQPQAMTILDPFMGSGTTLRAAKDLSRKAIGIELEEKYCEIAARRMAQEVLL